jgi:Kef-type K+ transport system membrane component KefB
MNSLPMFGAALLAFFAGVSLVALYSRRVGNSRSEVSALFLVAIVMVIGFIGETVLVDRLALTTNQRWWVLRAGFVLLSLILWRTSHRLQRTDR